MPDPWRRTQACDRGVACFPRHCDWRCGVALTIKRVQKPGGRTKPGGSHMQAKFVQAKFVQAKSAVTQSAIRYRAPRRKILEGTLAALMAIPLAGLQTRHVAAAEQAVVVPSPALDGPA